MADTKRRYDSTVARIAGNVMSGLVDPFTSDYDAAVKRAVTIARAIVAETIRTEPEPEPPTSRFPPS